MNDSERDTIFFYLMNKKSGLTKITEIIVKLVNAYLIL